MIVSFKHKFIFIKNYKTAGSSIEFYLYNYLSKGDICAQTLDFKGINHRGLFNSTSLEENFNEAAYQKYTKNNMAFFAHMPAWLIKERLEPINKKLKSDIFKNFFKFCVIRNPFDVIVSEYLWQNNSINPLRKNSTFDDVLEEIIENKLNTYKLFNLNRVMDKKLEKILCDKIIKFENLNFELKEIFKKLDIPCKGRLDIHKKKSINRKHYREYYNNSSRNLVEKKFFREIELFNYNF